MIELYRTHGFIAYQLMHCVVWFFFQLCWTQDLEDVFFERYEEGDDVWLSALTHLECKGCLAITGLGQGREFAVSKCARTAARSMVCFCGYGIRIPVIGTQNSEVVTALTNQT